MRRILLVTAMLIAASSLALERSAASIPIRPTDKDEDALKQLIREGADAVVHADLARLDKFMIDDFRANAEGISFNKKMLLDALKSGQMKVAGWTIYEMSVSIRGNSASVTGRYKLSNTTYMRYDFSGVWDFTDRFVKQSDGSWRAVSSQSKRIHS